METTLTTVSTRSAVSRTGADALLQSGFLRAWRTSPNRPALDVAGEVLSFQDLGEKAAGWRQRFGSEPPPAALR